MEFVEASDPSENLNGVRDRRFWTAEIYGRDRGAVIFTDGQEAGPALVVFVFDIIRLVSGSPGVGLHGGVLDWDLQDRNQVELLIAGSAHLFPAIRDDLVDEYTSRASFFTLLSYTKEASP